MAKGFDPGELMNQARKMKEALAKAQNELKDRVVEADAGGGLVRVFVNGGSEVVGVKIAADAVDPDDVSMLEDLVMVAMNNALEKARTMSDDEMNKLTGGLGGGLGGLF